MSGRDRTRLSRAKCAEENCGHLRSDHKKRENGTDYCWVCDTGDGWGYKPNHPFIVRGKRNPRP